MSLLQSCPCGARFEVEDTFAGQTVSCPECQNPVRVPARANRPLRTSGYALASVMLGVMLTFTIVGTVLAVILGVVGLVAIARHRDRVTGAGYAVFGIVWGCIFTGVTLLALSRGEIFGTSWIRQQVMAGEVDHSGPLEFTSEDDGFAITRPSARWGVAKEALLERLQPGASLLLVNVLKDSYLAVSVEFKGPATMAQLRAALIKNFNESPPDQFFGKGSNNPRKRHFKERETHHLTAINGAEVEEITLDGREMGQALTFQIRIIKDDDNRTVYYISAWAQSRRFADVQPELKKAMDSFRILKDK